MLILKSYLRSHCIAGIELVLKGVASVILPVVSVVGGRDIAIRVIEKLTMLLSYVKDTRAKLLDVLSP